MRQDAETECNGDDHVGNPAPFTQSLRGIARLGVPEGTVQDIVGHERSTLTGSTYSGKSTFEMRRDALAKLVH